MMPFRRSARLAALIATGALVMSCDSRLPTQPGKVVDDVNRPTLTFVLSAGTNGTVEQGTPLTVTVTATDDQGVALLLTSIRNSAQSVVKSDSVAVSPASKTTARTLPVPLAGLAKGEKLTIRATATDVSQNVKVDSIVVTVSDTIAPTMTVNSSKAGTTLKGGDVLDVRVTATDSSGIRYAGYRLQRVTATDTVRVKSDSAIAPTSAPVLLFSPAAFSYTLPDSLLPGTYQIAGFALDRSGVAGRASSPVTITIADGKPPVDTIVEPQDFTTLRVGDSLHVVVNLHDNVGLGSVTFRAFSRRGKPNLGTDSIVTRYVAVTAPATGTFRTALRDTVGLERFLKVVTPLDSIGDTLYVVATVTDIAGLVGADTAKVLMTNGPKVSIGAPVAGDSVITGSPLPVTVRATSSAGVRVLGFTVKVDPSGPAWPTPVADSQSVTYPSPLAAAEFSGVVKIPNDAPKKGRLVITPFAVDANALRGVGGAFTISVRESAPPAPRVTQVVASRLETSDSIFVSASGDRLTWIGFELRDANNAVYKRDSVHVAPAGVSSVTLLPLHLKLPIDQQGQRLGVVSFARDTSGRIGYTVPASVQTPQTDRLSASVDFTTIVYGQTFALPRAGQASDISVDTLRGNVYVSNTTFNRLERWAAVDSTFDKAGVAVGALPWGMAVQNDGDTLLVANSGGTNISKVCINPAACGAISEVISQRILTRNTYVYTVTETKDENGKVRLSLAGPFSYSDRPQYVQQSKGGRVFYSTRPTTFAPAGTIRWLDPKLPVPDPRQIHSYAAATSDSKTFAVFNSDSVKIYPAPANSSFSDQLAIFDHIYGSASGGSCQVFPGDPVVPNTICGRDSVVVAAAVKVNAQGGDVEAVNNLDVASLGLTDTTFVAASGDRARIAFGEGNTHGGVGRVIVVDDADPAGVPGPYSPNVTVRDLLENASEAVFGLGLDKHGSSAVVHGSQSYFASIDTPFHLRLQGTYDTFDQGAGIAFHPNADIGNPPRSGVKSDQTRTAFVASANGSIEIVDAGFYVSRGSLAVKGNLYGPLRAANRFLTDPPDVVLKLFGLTSQGLVVINLRASDIKDAP